MMAASWTSGEGSFFRAVYDGGEDLVLAHSAGQVVEHVVDRDPQTAQAGLAAALARLVTDPALRARMGAAGRARAVALYDEAAVLARTLDLLGL